MADTTFWTNPDEKAKALRWLVGLGGTWIILTLMVDLGETSELAVALALVVAGSVILQYGPEVFKSLGIATTAPKGGTQVNIFQPNQNMGWGLPVSGAKISQGMK